MKFKVLIIAFFCALFLLPALTIAEVWHQRCAAHSFCASEAWLTAIIMLFFFVLIWLAVRLITTYSSEAKPPLYVRMFGRLVQDKNGSVCLYWRKRSWIRLGYGDMWHECL